MKFNPQKFFVIVGNPYSGKTRTIQEIFRRRNFFAFKHPIQVPWEEERFVVINGSDKCYSAQRHLHKIKAVINHRVTEPVTFVTPLSFCFDGSGRDVSELIMYFNHFGIDLHYMVLSSSFTEKKVVSAEDLAQFSRLITTGEVHFFDKMVTNSPLRFEERNEELIKVMKQILSREGRWASG